MSCCDNFTKYCFGGILSVRSMALKKKPGPRFLACDFGVLLEIPGCCVSDGATGYSQQMRASKQVQKITRDDTSRLSSTTTTYINLNTTGNGSPSIQNIFASFYACYKSPTRVAIATDQNGLLGGELGMVSLLTLSATIELYQLTTHDTVYAHVTIATSQQNPVSRKRSC